MPKHIRNPDLPQQKKERYLLTDVLPTVFALHCLLDNLIMGDPRVKMPDRIQCKTDTHKADHGLKKCAVILSAQQTPMSCRVVLLGGHTHRPVLGRHRFAPARGIVPFLLDIMRPTAEHSKLLVHVAMQKWKKSNNGKNDIGDERRNHLGKCLGDTRCCQSIALREVKTVLHQT